MKKITSICIFLTLFSHIVFAQVETRFYPDGGAIDVITTIKEDFKASRITELPDFDLNSMVQEDKILERSSEPSPYRFGKGFDTDIGVDLKEDGKEGENGRTWSMEFYSKGALSINFVIGDLNLGKGAELYLINESRTMTYGPVTNESNMKEGVFLTDLIQGERVTMYVHEPIEIEDSSKFTIKRVVHAYRGLGLGEMSGGNPGASESCNNDLACFSSWLTTGYSEALVLLSNGNTHCSGCLLMSTDSGFRPFFLSAFHCIDTNKNGSLSSGEISNAQNWMFKFGYRKVNCTSSTNFNWNSFNGATFRAGWDESDFVLMELLNYAPLNYGTLKYSGWDRRTNTPTSGASIHHPAGDFTKISIENDPFGVSSWGGYNNMWLVNFDDGVVQHGSSGAPIFNQNKRVVGQLKGNNFYNPFYTYCSQPRAEYGRFHLSWSGGGTNSTRLKNWLDPCNTGAQTTNTTDSPHISQHSTVPCTGRSFTVFDLPSGSTINWTSSSNLTRTSPQGSNPATFRANSIGNAWVKATVTPPNSCGGSFYVKKNTYATGGEVMTLNLSGPGSSGWITATANGGSSPYTWTFNGNTTWTTTSSTTNKYVGCGGGHLYVQASNTCGATSASVFVPQCSGGGGYYLAVYPNPAFNEITVEKNSGSNNFRSAAFSFKNSVTLTLFDFNSSVVKTVTYKENTEALKMDISGLKKGKYFLKISGEGVDETHQVIVE